MTLAIACAYNLHMSADNHQARSQLLVVSGTCTLRNSLKAGPYCSPEAASCWYSCTVSRGTVALALWASMLRSAMRRAEFWALDSSACEGRDRAGAVANYQFGLGEGWKGLDGKLEGHPGRP
jgi:hypothetical protein